MVSTASSTVPLKHYIVFSKLVFGKSLHPSICVWMFSEASVQIFGHNQMRHINEYILDVSHYSKQDIAQCISYNALEEALKELVRCPYLRQKPRY